MATSWLQKIKANTNTSVKELVATATPLPEPEPVVKVATKHIPYVESLWNELEASRKAVELKEAYIREANKIGVKTASVSAMEREVVADRAKIDTGVKTLTRIKQALALGLEPTTPNTQWYAGSLGEAPRDQYGNRPSEHWPCRNVTGYIWYMAEFKGPIPLEALSKYAAVQHIVDDVRVYSPRMEDFDRVPDPVPHDPVIIGSIQHLSKPQYFEIARWDVDQDLASLFGQTMKPKAGALR